MIVVIVTKPSKSSYRSVLSGLLLFLKSVFNEVILIELLNDIFYLLLIKSCLKLF